MTEKYKPKSARGRIAQGVEITAGKEFGPERLTKQDVARALNLTETELPDEDWREISEFAVNAGCDLIRASVDTYLPKNPNRKEVHDIRETIAASSKDRLPFHDIFHAAETYRLSGGASAAARFASADKRERFTEPQIFSAELYPLLFFPFSRNGDIPENGPVSVALQFKESRARLATFLGVLQSGDTLRDEVVSSLLGPPPETAGGRKKEYEMFVEAVLLLNNQQKMEDVTCEELSAMSAHFAGVLNNPPEHYETFAHRVFAEEWRTNPRLFLDELLECIRTKPVTT